MLKKRGSGVGGPLFGKTPSGLTPTRAVFYAAPPGASSARFGPNSVAALQRLQVLPGKTWRELARRTGPKYLSAMIQAADIEQMGMHERLQTMELLWASLAGTHEALPSPTWHGKVVAARCPQRFAAAIETCQEPAKSQNCVRVPN